MPLSLNARAATFYKESRVPERAEIYRAEKSKANLMQNRQNGEYNGELSSRAKTRIKNLAANLALIRAANNGITKTRKEPEAHTTPRQPNARASQYLKVSRQCSEPQKPTDNLTKNRN